MRKTFFYLALTALIFISCKKEEKTKTEMALGDFVFATEHLSPGQTVNFTYNGTDEESESFYYYMVNNRSFPVDLNVSPEKTGTISIPDSAQAVAFNFKINGKFQDNNKEGFLIPLVDTEGNEIPGSKAALANYVMRYGKEFGIDIPKDSLFNDIKTELMAHPELKKDWNLTFLNLAYRQNKEEGESLINDYIDSTTSKDDITEDEYISLVRLYNTVGKKELADSITETASAKFPQGKMVENAFGDKFYNEKDFAKKEAIFEDYKSKYEDLGNAGNYMVRTLANMHFANGDMDKFNSFADMIADKVQKAGLYNSVAWPLAEKGENLEFAGKISKTSLDLLKDAQTNLDKKPDYYTVNQYKKSLQGSYEMYADTYALIAFKSGNVKEAISYQEEAIGDGKSSDVNGRYIEFLMADKQYDLAQTKAEEFIKNGHASTKIKDLYKEAFLSNSNDAKTFDSKLSSLEKVAHERYVSEIKETMIDEPAPTFSLKDTSGEEVSLASLKGKTVILDFWATWCGPCKASFPGMQQVVTKYKDDSDVVLLFVDTFESGENREKLVTDFIAKNNYDFHVVYDAEVEGSSFEVAEKYGVTGIPTKVIIDKEGKIRFKAVGYSGQTEKLVSEMDIMIEILKS